MVRPMWRRLSSTGSSCFCAGRAGACLSRPACHLWRGMFELLFLVALLAWLFFSALEFVMSLPCAPTLVAAFLSVPLIAAWRYAGLVRSHRLGRVRPETKPVPPERFFWPLARRRLGLRFVAALLVAGIVWPIAVLWPADWSSGFVSLVGWLAGASAILASGEAFASGCLYLRASHWFDRCAPGFIGWARRLLYRISDNPEFLGEEPLPRQRPRREKVY